MVDAGQVEGHPPAGAGLRQLVVVALDVADPGPPATATTRIAASTVPTPASMFLRNRTWPGTSTKPSSWPDGSVVKAKPRSMVRPRVFSSGHRSGSVPVRARTSDDFPWSTCPAVATTRIPTSRQSAVVGGARQESGGEALVLGGVHR